jgi:hypothetical protein
MAKMNLTYYKNSLQRLARKSRIVFTVQVFCFVLLLPFLSQCAVKKQRGISSDEVLSSSGFRLLDSPKQIVPWRYYYGNRNFTAPSYRTPRGDPLPGWSLRLVATRRFFTNQSARIYYRIEDFRQGYLFSSTTRGTAEMMRVWPVGTVLVLETFAGEGAMMDSETPLFVDCIRKFQPDASNFPGDTLFAGVWSYQRFGPEGELQAMPGGASDCHQCHGTALPLTGDLVFTVISKDAGEK